MTLMTQNDRFFQSWVLAWRHTEAVLCDLKWILMDLNFYWSYLFGPKVVPIDNLRHLETHWAGKIGHVALVVPRCNITLKIIATQKLYLANPYILCHD